jgi:hypothetical protein
MSRRRSRKKMIFEFVHKGGCCGGLCRSLVVEMLLLWMG